MLGTYLCCQWLIINFKSLLSWQTFKIAQLNLIFLVSFFHYILKAGGFLFPKTKQRATEGLFETEVILLCFFFSRTGCQYHKRQLPQEKKKAFMSW